MTTMTPTRGSHPPDVQLASFADGRLDQQSRAVIVEHLADCDDCYAVVQTIADFANAERRVQRSTTTGFRRRRWLAAPAAAVAACAIFVYVTPEIMMRRNMRRLAAAAETLRYRQVQSRLDESLAYRELEEPRGGTMSPAAERVLGEEAADVLDTARRAPTTANLRRAGIAMLLIGADDDAIAYLDRAVRQSRRRDAEALAILAAAYQARAVRTRSFEDAASAVSAAEEAWAIEKTPLTAWNRAVALTHVGSPAAGDAWRQYLVIDSTSRWADEARQRVR